MKKKSISIVINARLGSSRVHDKLLKKFSNTTLIEIALKKINELDFFENRYLAVAEKKFEKILSNYKNVKLLKRTKSSVKKGVNPLRVTFNHYLKIPSDFIFVFNPCLPFLSVKTIKYAYQYFQKNNYNSFTAVISTGDWIFDSQGKPLTNSNPSNVTTNKNMSFFKGCHAFHIINKSYFKENKLLWSFKRNDPHLIEIPSNEATDIDTPYEFELANLMYSKKNL